MLFEFAINHYIGQQGYIEHYFEFSLFKVAEEASIGHAQASSNRLVGMDLLC